MIVDDALQEGAEWFAVQASKQAGMSSNVKLSAADRTRSVRIAGNDRKVAPHVTLTATSGGSTLLGGEMVTGAFSVAVTFGESVTGFDNADLKVENATKGDFVGSGASYTATITPTTAGVVRVWVPALAGKNTGEFWSKPSRVFEVVYNMPATVDGPSVASFVASASAGGSFTATLRYNDGVTGVCLESFEVTGGTVTGFEALNDHPSFSVDHTYHTVVKSGAITETGYDSIRGAVIAGADEHELLRVTTEYRSRFRVTIRPDTVGGAVTIKVPAGAGVDRNGRRSQAATLSHTAPSADTVEVTAVRSHVALGERALFRLARASSTGTPTVKVRVAAPQGVLPKTAPTQVTFADGERFRIVTLDTSPGATITDSDNRLTLTLQSGTGYTLDPAATTARTTLLKGGFLAASGVVEVDGSVLESAGSVVVRFVLTTDVDERPWNSPGVFRLRTSTSAALLPPSAARATAGDDFVSFDESVRFAVRDFARVEVSPGVWRWRAEHARRLVIVDDALQEGAEWFAVQASKQAGMSSNVKLSAADRTRSVRIAGNDRKVAPHVTLTATSGGSTLLGGEMVTGAFSVAVTFGESVTGFDNADLKVENATKGDFVGSGASYTATITPTTAGVVRVWVPALAGKNTGEFWSKPSRVFEVVYNMPATVDGPSVASFVASASAGGSFTATLRYNDGVTGVCLESFEVTGGTVTGFEALNDHPSFSVDHTYHTVVKSGAITETGYDSIRGAVIAGADEHELLRVTTEYRSRFRVTIRPDTVGGAVTIKVPAGAGVDRNGRRSQAATLSHTAPSADTVEVTAVRSHVALGERALFRLARASSTGTPTVKVRVAAPQGVLPKTAPTQVTFADGERFRIVTLDTSPGATITDSDNRLTLTLQSGTGYTLDPAATTARTTLLGPDERGVVVQPGTLTIHETLSKTYSVALASEPTAGVTVAISSDDTNVASLAPATLTFATTDWQTAQTVTVTAAGAGTTTITHTVSGGNYEGLRAARVSVFVADDDVVVIDPAMAIVAAGGTGTYTVALATAPSGTVTVSVASGDVAVATVAPVLLTFTASNWATPQTVKVTGISVGSATIGHSFSGADYGSGSAKGADFAVTVAERAVQIDPESLSLAVGASGTYTVALAAPPSGNVTISVASGAVAVATVDKALLTFTTANWATPQTVTATAAGAGTTTITHTVTGADYGANIVTAPAVTVGVRGVAVSESSLTVDEGATGTYTVVLDAQPASDVVIAVTAAGSSDVTVDTDSGTPGNQNTLTFTSTNWSTAQTVTVTAADDADTANDAASISHAVVAASSADEYDAVTVAGVAVTVADDDTAGVTVSVTTLTVAEGAKGTYTVVLDAQPTSDVVITVTSNNSDVTVDTNTATTGNQNMLTFTSTNWSTAQTVTVTAAQDNDAANDAATLAHAVVAASSADEYDAVTVAGVAVTVTDDDTAAVTVSKSALPVAEGANGTYTVKLDTQPASDVVITVTSNNSDVTVDTNTATTGNQNTLTFTSTNWNTAQTVTVTAADDADAANDAASIAHAVVAASSADEYDTVTVAAVAVTVTDDETAAVTVSVTTLPVAEGANGAYTVKLDTPPTSDVVINLTKSGSPDVTVSPATLTFTPSNWSTAQTVTVRAAADADAADDRASISHAVDASRSADEYDTVTVAAVAVTVTDNDTPGVTVSVTTLRVAEGATGAYTVKLNAQPTSDVVINVTKSGSPDVTVSPATLTFTPSNWSTAQTVTVRAAADADAADDRASISHAVDASRSADEYDAVTVEGVAVTVTDDETAAVTVSESTLTVAEGANGAYTVKLNTPPTSDVVINLTKSGSPDVTVSPATLTFTPSNWNTAQTVTVTAAQDNDAANDAATLAHAVVDGRSADEYDAVTVAGVTVTVTDDDTAAVTVSVTTLTVAEGANGAYTVVLDTQPTSDVVITVTSNNSDVTVSPATLTFSSSNWSTAQTVTVSAADDVDAVNDAASISHAVVAASSADEYDDVTIAGVAVTVTDDDTAGVTVSKSTLTVAEGANGAYTVKLDTQPASDVVINLTKSGSPDVTVSPATLTFTPSNWSTAQTVTVSAADDDDAVNDAATLAHAVDASRSANEYDTVTVAGVAVTVTDGDTAAVTVSVTTLRVDEDAKGTYTVVLDAQPTSDVVIAVTAAGSSDVTVSPATLTFSSSNWRTAQTVTVTAADDADTANDAASISHAVVAASSADEYDTVTVAAVAVTVADDDTAGVTVSVTTLPVAEGATGAYTVKLNTQPASNVVITVTSNNSDVTVDTNTATTGNQNMLTFTSTNWSTAQTVTVTAAQDNDAANDAASISHAVVAASSADEYDAVTVAAVAVTVTDDDTAAVTVSKSTLPVAEGATGTYTVKLDTQPASDVVITVTSNNSDVTVDTNTATTGNQNTLTFTSTNWNTAQTVTVTAAQDADAANDTATLTHAVDASRSADEYDTVTIAAVAVTVTDDETAAVTVSVTTLTVAEGANGTYTVKLNTQPTSDVVINVTASGSPDVTVDTDTGTSGDQNTLTFTSTTWSTAQTVTVTAAHDADAADDTATLAHAVDASRSADEYDTVTIAAVAVTVTDDETAAVTVSVSTLTVAEGANGAYTVKLDAQPTSDVVINVTASGSPDVTVSPATLTFTPSNWSTAQTVTVRAAADADAADDRASISHAVDASRSADEYDAVTVEGVAVTVADDETAAVTVSESTLTVAEGANGAYTVKLNTPPTSDVVINLTKSGSPDVTVSPATLTFTPSNWNTAQTVTVTAADDNDAANDAATLAHAVVDGRSADEYDAVTVAGVTVTVTDDDTAAVTVSVTTLTVAEGANGAYTVVLDTQPTSDVVITVTSNNSDVTVSPATLTFSSSNWSTAQTVTVSAADDVDAVNDAATLAHAVDASRSADEYDAVTVAAVAVTVTDDDTAAVTVSVTTLTVAEDANGAYTVVLDAQPTSDVVINLTKSGSPDVTVSPATLTFTPSNWSTAQTVTVSAADDVDAVNDAATLAHAVDASRSADEYDAVTVAGVAVTVTDDDTAAVTVSVTTLRVDEGANGTYTVVLDAQPTSNVVIAVTAAGSSDVTVSPATLTFSSSNWRTAQTVTVTAADDADTANDAASISHAVVAASSADEYDTVTVAGVAVTVTDDDTAGVTVSRATLTVDEGAKGAYTVVLNTQPASDVVINVTATGSSDVTVDTDSATGGNQNTLTFTSTNWNTAQTVTVTAAQDNDAANDTASIAHAVVAASSADEYDAVTVAAVAVTVTDDDTAGVTVSKSTLPVAEGANGTYTVKLDTQPASDVVITVTSNNSDVTVDTNTGTGGNQNTLTFTSTNWNTAQTVTVTAADDADAANDAASISHAVVAASSADEYDTVTVAAVAVTVTDDETAAVTVSVTTLPVAEGANGTYTVKLDTPPTSDVVINLTKSGSPDVTVSPATLTFTPSNWSTAQTVTVRAAADADAADDRASISHAVDASRSAGEYDTVTVAGVAVTVTDNDTAAVTVSVSTLTVAEDANGTYTVVLDAQPTSDVVINVTAAGSPDVTVSPATLTFTPSNWSTAQTVTVRAAADADAADDRASISHAVDASRSAGEYDAVTVEGVAVTVTDDETAAVTVSESTLTVAEGANGAYTVKLNTPPTSDVVINLTKSGSPDVTVSPATLTFTPSNWNTAQTVTVTAAQDNDAANDAATLAHAVVDGRSADEYDAVTVAGVAVTVTDDDTAAVTVSVTTLTVAEGANGAYTVVLDTQPASDVVITVTSNNSDVTVSPATLTFSSSNWSTAQTVTVSAADDVDAVNDAASISHAVVAASSADEYDDVTIAGVAVTVTDDDTAGVTVSKSTLTVAEDANGAYTVVLDTQPTSDVVINLTKSGSPDVTVSPATLTFTPSNWSTAQTVTVSAADDDDAVNDAATLAHAVDASRSANEYDAVTVAAVAVTVTDDDTAGVTVSVTTLRVDEDAKGTYTVVLDAQPTSDVVIAVTAAGSSDVTVSPATLTFSSSNWRTAQTVTVTAADDADTANDAASISHAVVDASSADEYDTVTVAGVAVTVTDDDTAGVTVSRATLTVDEGAKGAYTVVLNTQPASDVVINVTATGSSDVTVDTDSATGGNQNTLTFTSTNWNTAQTVTVTAAQDNDAANDTASIAHAVVAASSADEYDAVTVAAVAVTVTDDETAGVTVSTTTLPVDEGANGTYTVKLNTQPASDVVITVTSNNSDVTVDTDTRTSGNQNTLTFTSSNWSTAQTVTVTAADDADAVNDAATLAHAVVTAGSADEYDTVTIAGVTVTVTDGDTAGVTVSTTTLMVDEGATGTYTVVLNTQPTSDVVINVTATGSSDVTVDTDTGSSGNQNTLTFTSTNWNTAQTVTVAAAQDNDAVNDAATLAHAVVAAGSADEYDAVTVAGVTVTVTDGDTAGVTVSKTTLTVAEGATGTYTVVLDAQPTSDVVINVTATGSSDVTVDTNTGTGGNQNTLTFTSTNWSTAQTVTVAAAQDADAANDTASIAHAVVAASSADEYDAVTVAGVAVTVTDDETAGVTVSRTTLPVDEGANGAYTVKLNTQPASDVVITVTSNNSDVTVDTDTGTSGNQNTLTFTSSNWSTAQTVTVTAADDADAANDAATLAHAVVDGRSADEYDAVTVAGVAVTVTDDETAGVTVSTTTLTVDEGANGTYTVVLNTPPASDVVINVTATGSSDVTVSPSRLTFSSSDWSTAQTVTVSAADDADAVNDAASIAHAVVAAGSADEYDTVTIAGVTVTVTDDETAAVTVSVTTLRVAEGAKGTYTVVLDAQPASDVVIAVTAAGSSDVTVSPSRLTFSSSDWSTAQTVTVAAADDGDTANDAATLAHAVVAASSADEYDAVTVAGVAVTVTDDDTAGVTVSRTTLTVAEGATGTYTVVLDTQPASDVVINVTASGSSDVTVDTDTASGNQNTLTFTSTNWNTAQTVTVTAADDADAANDAASISHAVVAASSADEYDAMTIAGVTVTVADNDTAGVTVSESTLTVDEGANGTYTVKLNTQPASDVVINVTATGSSDVTVDTDTASGNQNTLTFTSTNWNTAQTVTVTAADDADAANDAASISHAVVAASSADEYDTVTIAGVTVTVADNDTAGVRVSVTTLTVDEGATGAYTVKLNTQPASNVVINVTATGSSDVTVDTDTASGNQNTLTFTSTNWNTAQTVTVTAAQDADAANDAASISHAVVAASSANEYDTVTIARVAVTVADNDTAGVTVSVTTLTVAEGATGAYTVKLNTQPASDVVITVTSNNSDVTVDTNTGTSGNQNTLTFTSTNWNTAQTVTVTAAQDADAANDAASISHAVVAASSADEYDDVTIAGVAVTVTDDETAGVTVSKSALTVAEGANGAYTVVLNTQPASDVVIAVTAAGSSDVTVDTDTASGNQNTLTFTPSTWSTAQTVTVTAADDDDAVNDTATLAHAVVAASSADEYDTVTVAAVAVTVTDDDTAAVTVSVTTLRVDEDAKGTYTVVLDAQPTSDVVIAVTAAGSSDVTVSPATLTFSSSNWRTAQTVTVTAADDADTANDAASISHAVVAARSADEYDAVTVAAVAVTVADDDTAGVRVSVTTLTVAEGATGAYTVKLNTQPASNVVIAVTAAGSSDVTVDTDTASGNQNTLTFTSTTWNTAQTVTVSAAHDADAANDAATLTHAVVAASSANEYDTVTVAGVAVTVTDDDTAGVTVSTTTLTVAEGANGTYTVKLNTQPASDVVINVTATGSSDVTVDTDTATSGNQNTLTFTPSTWNTAQTVTVSAADDADSVNDTATLTHAVVAAGSADEYDDVTVAAVAVTVTDDDAGVTVSESTLTVAEGANGTYTVVLNTQPASDVVISVTATGNSDVTVSPSRLTFSSSDWSTAQTVTVTAADDADAANDTASIAHEVVAADSADAYDGVTVTGVAVNVTDDDTAGVTFSRSTLAVTKGATNFYTYTVVLNAQPASDVVITITSNNSDVTVDTDTATSGDQNTLTFTPSNWDTAQTVAVSAAHDADAADDAASISHEVVAADSADEYDDVTAAVTVAVRSGPVVEPITVRVNLVADGPDGGAIVATKFATRFGASAVPTTNTPRDCTTARSESEVDDRGTSRDTSDDVAIIRLNVIAATSAGSCRYDVTLHAPAGYSPATGASTVRGVEPGAVIDISVRVAVKTIILLQNVVGDSGGASARYALSTTCAAPGAVVGLPPPLLPRLGGGGIVTILPVTVVALTEGRFNVTAALADDLTHPDASNGVELPSFDRDGDACVATISVTDLPDRCAAAYLSRAIDLLRAPARTIVEMTITCSDEIEKTVRGESRTVVTGLPAVRQLTITSADVPGIYTVHWMTRNRCDPGHGTSGASGSVVLIVRPSEQSDPKPTSGELTGSVVEELVRVNTTCTYAWNASLVKAATGAVCTVGPAPFAPDRNNRIAITALGAATHCTEGATIGLEVLPAEGDLNRGAVLAHKFTALAVPADGAPEHCTVSAAESDVDDADTPNDVTDDKVLIELTVAGGASSRDDCRYDVTLRLPGGFSPATGTTITTRNVVPGATVALKVAVATPSVVVVQNVVGGAGSANAQYELSTSCTTPASTQGSLSSLPTAEGSSRTLATRRVLLLPGRFNITAVLLRNSPDSEASNGIALPALDGDGLACRTTISMSDLPDECTVAQDRADVDLPGAAETTIVEFLIDCSR